MNISHDSVNRFILRERFTPKDLFDQAKPQLELEGGVLSVYDSILDKPYSHHMALVGHFWSGKHHRSVKGIDLITLYYTDTKGHHLPINYRLYDHSGGKAKNDYFLDMLADVISWGVMAVKSVDIREEGLTVWLREFGFIRLYRTTLKNEHRHYALYLPDDASLNHVSRCEFEAIHDTHWKIEQCDQARAIGFKLP